jgi:hypothetical protein
VSENIDDSPLSKDIKLNEDIQQNFVIPEFSYHENDIKSIRRGPVAIDLAIN